MKIELNRENTPKTTGFYFRKQREYDYPDLIIIQRIDGELWISGGVDEYPLKDESPTTKWSKPLELVYA